jgi:hypothetical protein
MKESKKNHFFTLLAYIVPPSTVPRKSLVLKEFFDFCHRPLGIYIYFSHTFLVSLKTSYSLDVPFGGLNFINRHGLVLQPFKVQFLAIRIT